MLAKRVILCLCFEEGVLMRTKRFRADLRYTQSHCVAGDADELVLLDITRSGSWPGFPDLVARYCQRLDLPAAAGGNVRSVEYAIKLLNAGCEKVVVGWGGRSIYAEVAEAVGKQSLVAGIDCSRDSEVVSDQGTKPTGKGVPEICREAAALGAGEILLTSIERDGSLGGYDLALLSRLRSDGCLTRVPTVIAGGCGRWEHVRGAFEEGAQGAVTSNIFHMNASAMRACKLWLAENYSGPIREAEAS